MPLDKSNGCHDALQQKIDLQNYLNLTPTRKGKIDNQLSSNKLVVSIKKGKNKYLFVPGKNHRCYTCQRN